MRTDEIYVLSDSREDSFVGTMASKIVCVSKNRDDVFHNAKLKEIAVPLVFKYEDGNPKAIGEWAGKVPPFENEVFWTQVNTAVIHNRYTVPISNEERPKNEVVYVRYLITSKYDDNFTIKYIGSDSKEAFVKYLGHEDTDIVKLKLECWRDGKLAGRFKWDKSLEWVPDVKIDRDNIEIKSNYMPMNDQSLEAFSQKEVDRKNMNKPNIRMYGQDETEKCGSCLSKTKVPHKISVGNQVIKICDSCRDRLVLELAGLKYDK